MADEVAEARARLAKAMLALASAHRGLSASLDRLSLRMEAFAIDVDEKRAPAEVDMLLWDLQATGEVDPFS